ncbi:MAG: ABC transporter permease [Candidatus Marinimicrobia bacterium]|nr:ABC transporter permease [Candidatus Neomarinimicrobiota bacterium]
MNFFFSVSEGIKGLRRIKGAALLAVLILSLSIAMVGMSAVVGWNGKKFVKFLRSQFDLTTFVVSDTPDEIIIQLGGEIGKIEGVRDVIYISPSQAARKFKKEFGEDVVDIVGTNPFPSSFIVRLSPEFGTAVDASYIASRIASMKGIEEVRYRKSLLVSVDRYVNILIGLSTVIGVIVLLAAVLISSYTIKLTIFAKRDLIWTMRLVGATDRFIRRPFIVEGLIEGFAAGVIGIGIIEAGYIIAGRLLQGYIPVEKVEVNNEIYAGMLVFGVILGWMSSSLSVRRYLKEKM